MEYHICELCGSQVRKLHAIEIERSIMNVCNTCKTLGKEVKLKPTSKKHKRVIQDEEEIEDLIDSYGKIIENAIVQHYGSIKSFCSRYNYSERYLREIIREDLKPTIEEARKLERLLRINLVIKEKISREETETKTPIPEKGVSLRDYVKDPRLKHLLEED